MRSRGPLVTLRSHATLALLFMSLPSQHVASPRLGLFGATGAVGVIARQLLLDRALPHHSIRFFGSPTSKTGNRRLAFGEQSIEVEPLVPDRVRDLDLVIACVPDEVARLAAPWVTAQGGILVDESAAHRMDSSVPLVIPEVNAAALARHQGIIASPNCSTTQMVLCLKPLHDAFGLRRVVVSTYQAASGAGAAATRELLDHTRLALEGHVASPQCFDVPLPFNVWPKIGSLRDDGMTSEEFKMVAETRKILELPELPVAATCVRVPVANGHSESLFVETVEPVTREQALGVLATAPGITILDGPDPTALPTPQVASGRDDVLVGRVRVDASVPHGIALWCASDNLRKGAATNAVQIAEALIALSGDKRLTRPSPARS